jgi:hypothetical protein
MASEIRANLISPATASTVTLGSSGQTIALGSGATATGFGGGKILQVVSITKTDVATASTGWNDITGMSISITPSATSSKIFVLVHANICNVTTVSNGAMVRLVRDSTAIAVGDADGARIQSSFEFNGSGTSRSSTSGSIMHLDEPTIPAPPVAITYKLQGYSNSGTFGLNRINPDNNDAYTGRHSSSITAMEIGA